LAHETKRVRAEPVSFFFGSGEAGRRELVSNFGERVYMPTQKFFTPTPERGAFKLKEARQYLGGLSVPTMHRLIRKGQLKPNRQLRHLIFSRAELDRFLSQ
jgi:hypothetical protein